jgi:hypothetical protein
MKQHGYPVNETTVDKLSVPPDSSTPMGPYRMIEESPPHAVVTRVGRWMWHIKISDGLMETTPPWRAWGRKRAQRKAASKLGWYLARREPESFTVTS